MAKAKSDSTEWAAAFGVASELCKRGYKLAFTMGNHPEVDLMVRSPEDFTFLIDVKGQSTKSHWQVKPKRAVSNLFYVLAYVPEGEANQFFILPQEDLEHEAKKFRRRSRTRLLKIGKSVGGVGRFPGIPWKTAGKFKAKDWSALPK